MLTDFRQICFWAEDTAECDAGKKEMEKEILMLEEQFPSAAKGVAEFSTPLAHQIIAGKPCELASNSWQRLAAF